MVRDESRSLVSYREENGQVILTLSREDYKQLVRFLDFARAHIFGGEIVGQRLLEQIAKIESGRDGRKVAGMKL